MGRTSFTQELKELAKASEGMDAGGCWREVLHLHGELGRGENALGRTAWTMRYGQRGDWRTVLREAAAETLREARRAASVYDTVRLKEAAGCYSRLAGFGYGEVARLMLKPQERRGARPGGDRRERRFEHVAPEVRWIGEPPARNGQRRRGRGRRGSQRREALTAA
jgi:hypothetical protein